MTASAGESSSRPKAQGQTLRSTGRLPHCEQKPKACARFRLKETEEQSNIPESHSKWEAKRGVDLCLGYSSVATIKHPGQDNLEKKEVIWISVSGADQSIMAGKYYSKQQVCCRRQGAKSPSLTVRMQQKNKMNHYYSEVLSSQSLPPETYFLLQGHTS